MVQTMRYVYISLDTDVGVHCLVLLKTSRCRASANCLTLRNLSEQLWTRKQGQRKSL